MTASHMTRNGDWLGGLMVGDSLAMRRLRTMVGQVARSELPILITGPTGAGKELVAEAIHRLSGRSGPLVAVNVCALGESMFESALFGHVRGAFTGAIADVAGLVSEADHGTLFLDEIGALPLREQAKLLRMLETRRYRPVGAARDRASDFRLVTATNEDLDDAVGGARFREDLRHRLGVIVLPVPSLAQRRDDVPQLVRHFVGRASPHREMVVDEDAMEALILYEWTGNVRELRDTVNALIVFSEGARIVRSSVLAILDRRKFFPSSERLEERKAARDAMKQVLERCAWDTSRVAAELRVHRVTVYRRMQALGIRVPKGTRFCDRL